MKLTDGQMQVLHLFLFVVVALLLWNTIIMYPVKLFVVMLHEMSHGLMAVLFGGEIIEIQINRQMGGYCKFQMANTFWGNFMTSSAGYLGSLIWGIVILISAIKSERDKYITLIIGIILLGLSYFVYQTGEPFGTSVTIGLAIFMIVSYKLLPAFFHDRLLKFLGITSCVYVIWDIKDDLIDRTNVGSDADAIAALTGVPSTTVGVIWIFIAVITLFFTLKYVIKQQEIKM